MLLFIQFFASLLSYYTIWGILRVDWKLVANKSVCNGTEFKAGHFENIEECAEQCRDASTMFVFGRCKDGKCKCQCQTAAKTDGTCDIIGNQRYTLYAFTQNQKGKKINTYWW